MYSPTAHLLPLLESDWFRQMIVRGGGTPRARLHAMFDIAGQWMAAPGIREQVLQGSTRPDHATASCSSLRRFLADQAATAGAARPDVLASQLIILLQGAIAEELRTPGSGVLEQAASAARAVIAQACTPQKTRRRLTHALGGLAAGLAIFAGTALYPMAHDVLHPAARSMHVATAAATTPAAHAAAYSPDTMAEILALQRMIEQGQCPAPQLLAMPQGQVTAYMNVVKLRTPDNPVADRENMRAFLAWFRQTRASECYFAPHNGHTNVTWVSR